jgi:hypothetical protein
MTEEKKFYSLQKNVGYDYNLKQITFHDSRYYQRGESIYYPSVTYVLGYYPKGKFFEDWLKEVGQSADIIARKAADDGTIVHNLIERYLQGEKIQWMQDNKAIYTKEIWLMLYKFHEFWTTYKPTLIASELTIFSDEHKYAGTIDLVLEINDKIWLVDIKTSNNLHKTYELQTAAYAVAWNESHTDVKVENRGILWLKASTRGADSKGKKIQGKGWKLEEYDDRPLEKSFELFKHVYCIFEEENPDFKPHTEVYPDTISLEQ